MSTSDSVGDALIEAAEMSRKANERLFASPVALVLTPKQRVAILDLAQLALLGRSRGATVEVVRARLAELGLQLPEKGGAP